MLVEEIKEGSVSKLFKLQKKCMSIIIHLDLIGLLLPARFIFLSQPPNVI